MPAHQATKRPSCAPVTRGSARAHGARPERARKASSPPLRCLKSTSADQSCDAQQVCKSGSVQNRGSQSYEHAGGVACFTRGRARTLEIGLPCLWPSKYMRRQRDRGFECTCAIGAALSLRAAANIQLGAVLCLLGADLPADQAQCGRPEGVARYGGAPDMSQALGNPARPCPRSQPALNPEDSRRAQAGGAGLVAWAAAGSAEELPAQSEKV